MWVDFEQNKVVGKTELWSFEKQNSRSRKNRTPAFRKTDPNHNNINYNNINYNNINYNKYNHICLIDDAKKTDSDAVNFKQNILMLNQKNTPHKK